MKGHQVSTEQIEKARGVFAQNEPRDLFYRVATDLVERAYGRTSLITLADSLAVLLQTWNKAFYQFAKFDSNHFAALDGLLRRYRRPLKALRTREIEGLAPKDRERIVEMFERFETVLGPVGSAKVLHLLAPQFFPIWDRAIAKSYGVPLAKAGTNGVGYCTFMEIAKIQCRALRASGLRGNVLKQLDEYNYCRFTKRWL
jgi:hypothetical protein